MTVVIFGTEIEQLTHEEEILDKEKSIFYLKTIFRI